MSVRIETDRLLLRELEPEDLPGVLAVYVSNPGYLAMTEGNVDGPGSYDLGRLQRDRHMARITPGRVMLGIYLRETGDVVGAADYLECNPNDQTPWWGLLLIHGDLQGRGFGREAAEGLLAHFRELGWPVVRIGVLRENEGVRPFWERLGFREVAVRQRQTPHGPGEVIVLERSLAEGHGTA